MSKMQLQGIQVEALYRKYFYEVRGFRPFPMTVTIENVVDFVLWLQDYGHIAKGQP